MGTSLELFRLSTGYDVAATKEKERFTDDRLSPRPGLASISLPWGSWTCCIVNSPRRCHCCCPYLSPVPLRAKERAAMESWACNYVEGKGHADLMSVAAKWDAWASKNHPAHHIALYVLSPVFATLEEVPGSGLVGLFSPTSGQLGCRC